MEQKILSLLQEEINKLEVQLIIIQETRAIIDNLNISGKEAENVTQQKMMLDSSINLNKILVANLKAKIKKEDVANG